MMAAKHMTPVLAGLLVARETEPKTSHSMIRQDPARHWTTPKAIDALSVPVVLEVLSDGAWIELDRARNIDAAAVKAKGVPSGRFVQRGRVIAEWDESKEWGDVPKEEA
jgi:hypothetical protein